MTNTLRDFRRAARRLAGSPLFSAFAIGSLCIGIGATTAIYSVIDAVVFRPPAISNVQEVVNIYQRDPRSTVVSASVLGLSAADYADLKRAQTSFQSMTAWSTSRQPLLVDGSSESVVAESIDGAYFATLGVGAALGRVIEPSDDRASAPAVAMISDGLWRRRFAGDPAVLGKTVTLGQGTFTIVGVAPAAFRGVNVPTLAPTPVWVPLSTAKAGAVTDDPLDRERQYLFVKARLRPGVTVAAAGAEVRAIASQLDAAYPRRSASTDRSAPPTGTGSRPWHVEHTSEIYVHESVHAVARPAAHAVMFVAGAVLLVTCTNLANLLLARGMTRRYQLAVELALGASRNQLLRSELAEAMLLAAGGVIGGLAVARLVISAIVNMSWRLAPGMTAAIAPELNAGVVAACLIASGAAFAVFGLFPAVTLTRLDPARMLGTDNPLTAAPRWRFRRHLIAAQVAVSTLLAAAAFLSVQQIDAYAKVGTGFDLDKLALVRLDFRLQRDEPQARDTLRILMDRIRRDPSVEGVAVSTGLPSGLSPAYMALKAAGQEGSDASIAYRPVLAASPEIFRVLGVPIVAGRGFEERDSADNAKVIVLSESAAREVFGSADVLGRAVSLTKPPRAGAAEEPPSMATVVGIAANVITPNRRSRDSVAYVPFTQFYYDRIVISVRTSRNPATLVPVLNDTMRVVAPNLATLDVGTGTVLAGPATEPLRFTANLSGTLGAAAFFLTMVGVYGLVSYNVAGRTSEIGVRMALGADATRVRRMILVDGLRPIVAGLAAAVVLSIVVGLTVRPMLTRVFPAVDYLRTGVLLAAGEILIGVFACYWPARYASRVMPGAALRTAR